MDTYINSIFLFIVANTAVGVGVHLPPHAYLISWDI